MLFWLLTLVAYVTLNFKTELSNVRNTLVLVEIWYCSLKNLCILRYFQQK